MVLELDPEARRIIDDMIANIKSMPDVRDWIMLVTGKDPVVELERAKSLNVFDATHVVVWAYTMVLFALAKDKWKLREFIPIFNDPKTAIIISLRKQQRHVRRWKGKGTN